MNFNAVLDLPLSAFRWASNFFVFKLKVIFPEELALGPRFLALSLLETVLSGESKDCDQKFGQITL